MLRALRRRVAFFKEGAVARNNVRKMTSLALRGCPIQKTANLKSDAEMQREIESV